MVNESVYEYLLLCYMSSHRESSYFKALSGESKMQFNQRSTRLAKLGWRPLKTSEELQINEHGYFGVAYYKINKVTGEAEVVIAHRGTCFDKEGNVLADLEIAQQQLPRVLPMAVFKYIQKLLHKNYYTDAVSQQCHIEGYPITKITHTGFSLGGFIAGASAAISKIAMHAVTFDAPGIGGIVSCDAISQARIHNFVTETNLVNTCNKQVGCVSQFSHFTSAQFNSVADKQKDMIVDFYMEFNNFGLIRDNDSVLAIECDRKFDGANAAIREVGITFRSHNLEKIIRLHEDKTLSSEHIPVFLWPTATNDMIYGKTPVTRNVFTVGWDGGYAILGSLLAIGAQFAKSFYSLRVWNITKRLNVHGEHEGLIGVKHTRSNQIFYTQTEYEQFRLACRISNPTVSLQTPISLMLEAAATKSKQQTTKAGPIILESSQLTQSQLLNKPTQVMEPTIVSNVAACRAQSNAGLLSSGYTKSNEPISSALSDLSSNISSNFAAGRIKPS